MRMLIWGLDGSSLRSYFALYELQSIFLRIGHIKDPKAGLGLGAPFKHTLYGLYKVTRGIRAHEHQQVLGS